MADNRPDGIKLVVYDIDGVLGDVRDGKHPGHGRKALEWLAARLGWSQSQIGQAHAFIEAEEYGFLEMRGEAEPWERYQGLSRIGLPVEGSDIAQAMLVQASAYVDGYEVLPGALEHLANVRSLGLRTAALSDTDWVGCAARARYGLDSAVDARFYSCETGWTKHSLDAFRLVLDTMEVPAGEALFVDDRLACVLRAAELGLTGVLKLGSRGWGNDHRDDQEVRDFLSSGGLAIEALDELFLLRPMRAGDLTGRK